MIKTLCNSSAILVGQLDIIFLHWKPFHCEDLFAIFGVAAFVWFCPIAYTNESKPGFRVHGQL